MRIVILTLAVLLLSACAVIKDKVCRGDQADKQPVAVTNPTPVAPESVAPVNDGQIFAAMPASDPQPVAASAPTGVVLQMGAFKNEENAKRAAEKINALKLKDQAAVSAEGDKFLVLVGPFATIKDAKMAQTRLNSKSGMSGIITRR